MFDAAGNVFEWTASRYPDGRRVMKGAGSWDDEAGISRPAARHGRPPASRHILFGFRCVGPAEVAGPYGRK
jgi:formylglycine-generating enzyme required for sulfatase activity